MEGQPSSVSATAHPLADMQQDQGARVAAKAFVAGDVVARMTRALGNSQYSTRTPSWISRAPAAAVGFRYCGERRLPMWQSSFDGWRR